ncbi:MAG: PIG-L family deacetylase [Bacteroidetes bacterium]|nr:PIG-L family deacetylase [Bacteroidota bacterium]
MKFYRFVICILILLTGRASFAQPNRINNSADIFQQIKKLDVLGSVLYIAAHPDDENTRLLAWLSKGLLLKTGYLSLTRGDGGQNLIGDEQGIDLGLIRTQELLDARRIDGAQQFFSRAYDFGYCKTADEALATWGHEKILSDVVWVIRKFQPDVIITRFPGDARAGHGHHAASSILANEAFKDAADPTKFPEQLKDGVTTWKATRIFWNTFNFGGLNTTDSTQLKLDVGGYNNLLGKSYGELAAESRSEHKSQGFGVPSQRGSSYEYFLLTGGNPAHQDLLDGVDISWHKFPGGDKIHSLVQGLMDSYNFEHPEYSVRPLVGLYQSVDSLPNNPWKNNKLQEIRNLLASCSGLFTEVDATSELLVAGENKQINISVICRNQIPLTLKSITLNQFDSVINLQMYMNKNYSFEHQMQVPDNFEMTQPYWLKEPLDGGSFHVTDQHLIGKAENDPAMKALLTFDFYGQDITFEIPVQYKYTDPIKGELHEPVAVIPALEMELTPGIIFTNRIKDGKIIDPQNISLIMRSQVTEENKPVQLSLYKDKTVAWSKDTILNLEKGKEYAFTIQASALKKTGKEGRFYAGAEINDQGKKIFFNKRIHSIHYEHIPDIHYLATDSLKISSEKIYLANKRIAYIEGAGDKVVNALNQMGYIVTILKESDVTRQKLKSFDVVITGVRAYNVLSWLPGKHDLLMQFVHDGGNLIVQYNTNNQISGVPYSIGPYPFSISRTRVTDENAAVKFLLPQHSVMNFPNKITQSDFDHWIQERSIYQAEQLDKHYAAILGMHDAGEEESNGSLIIAPYGKGNFTYASLVFFRELPAGMEGAYKLFANLIALPGHL